MKTCVRCKYLTDGWCTRRITPIIDPVTGEAFEKGLERPRWERRPWEYGFRFLSKRCGPDGRYWEMKP